MLASIGEDLAEDGLHLVQHHDFAGRLNDLEWLRQQIAVGHAIGQTVHACGDDSGGRVLAEDFRDPPA